MAAEKYSLIIPVYQNESCIQALLERVKSIHSSLQGNLEAVFVVDGSPDRSGELLEFYLKGCSFSAVLVRHSRNYGSFAAMRTGLAVSTGSFCLVLSADLQEPPTLIPEFFKLLSTGDWDVVVGARNGRGGRGIGRFFSFFFWEIYRRLIVKKIPKGGVDVFGCTRRFAGEILKLNEAHSSLISLIFWAGFRRKTVYYNRQERHSGKSAWDLEKRFKYLSDSLFAFTDLPIKVLLWAGGIGICLSVCYAFLVVCSRILGVVSIPGFSATVVSITFFSALNLFGLGIIGSYAWRAYENTKQRPYAMIQDIRRFGERLES